MPKPNFSRLWNSYPSNQTPCDDQKPDGTLRWTNQCAIRMSTTLNAEGTIKVNRGTYSEPKCSHGHARGAESLANWLWKHHLGRPTIYSSAATAKSQLATKKGIIFFKDCFTRTGETAQRGDHIDLWDGTRAAKTKTYNDPGNRSKQVWFWELI